MLLFKAPYPSVKGTACNPVISGSTPLGASIRLAHLNWTTRLGFFYTQATVLPSIGPLLGKIWSLQESHDHHLKLIVATSLVSLFGIASWRPPYL
jgi:hypothetical protein